MASVTRYVLTFVNADGMRTLMDSAQGRYAYATAAEAHKRLTALLSNNSANTIRSVWGDDPRCEVRPCECYPGHFDPIGIYFDVE